MRDSRWQPREVAENLKSPVFYRHQTAPLSTRLLSPNPIPGLDLQLLLFPPGCFPGRGQTFSRLGAGWLQPGRRFCRAPCLPPFRHLPFLPLLRVPHHLPALCSQAARDRSCPGLESEGLPSPPPLLCPRPGSPGPSAPQPPPPASVPPPSPTPVQLLRDELLPSFCPASGARGLWGPTLFLAAEEGASLKKRPNPPAGNGGSQLILWEKNSEKF